MGTHDFYMESGNVSLFKKGEELCGDMVEKIYHDDAYTLVLADGLGSGVKANVLSTLTSKIIGTMMADGQPIEDCVATIVETLPVCSVRQVAYSTFTILQVRRNGDTYLVQFDNPDAILLRGGKHVDYPKQEKLICGKKIYESRIKAELGDMFILMSDGVIHAGVGMLLNFGWQHENVVQFVEENYSADMSAQTMAAALCGACNDLYVQQPGDDTTVAVLRVRERQTVNLMIGPPVDKADDERIIGEFLALGGKHIVCGGTTSTLVARHLGEQVTTSIDYVDPKIPPIGYIKGIDLVTEGVLTLGHVLETANKYYGQNDFYTQWRDKRDGASLIAKLLFEDATHINFYVGRSMNPAHQNPDLPINLGIKMRLVDDLVDVLRRMGKQVTAKYY
ncbi:SpoIIE family protein phosphatase [Feifania hominis]|uniref:SpoIIE family protein phosphatase n=1 Tax=Feifania hominis TaxID=2763660 RepID=A0A926DCV3_9FIRM|nr:SpoIIE family protein phosphatase [Feifania hominis]MBC8536258.1 SpoIIE family protein phosphatase [Feifania hominis]